MHKTGGGGGGRERGRERSRRVGEKGGGGRDRQADRQMGGDIPDLPKFEGQNNAHSFFCHFFVECGHLHSIRELPHLLLHLLLLELMLTSFLHKSNQEQKNEHLFK